MIAPHRFLLNLLCLSALTGLASAAPVITEFLASNVNGLRDEDATAQDWVEIHNPGPGSVDLTNWYLTDTATLPTKWQFPDVSMPAGSYLLVFTSGKDRRVPGSPLHTNFSLRADGEYLGLIRPDGSTVEHDYAPNFPAQAADVSYGLDASLNRATPAFFDPPTPGAVNGPPLVSLGQVDPVTSSPPRGLYRISDFPLSVSLSTVTPSATIRYTTDGSSPTETSGTVYASPIVVNPGAILRVAAFKPGFTPNRRSFTFLVSDLVLNQSPNGETPAPGWPAPGISVNNHRFDYGMDPEIVDNTDAEVGGRAQVEAALRAIPSVSVVTDMANLFDPTTGIYVNPENRGNAWEKDATVEWLEPGAGFASACGLRIRGGDSRNPANPKHSFHLYFRGTDRLNYPVFGAEGAPAFDRLDFRTAQNYSWSFEGSPRNTFLREEFSRRTFMDMGHPGSRVRYFHLYLNGQYWGLYDTDERHEANYCVSYFGGQSTDWDVVKSENELGLVTDATDGNMEAWNRLFDLVNPLVATDQYQRRALTEADYFQMQGLNANGQGFSGEPVLLDPMALADYMLLTFWSGNLDGATSEFASEEKANNWIGARNRTFGQGFRFFVHDFEHTMLDVTHNRTGPFNLSFFDRASWENKRLFYNPMFLHADLMELPRYRQAFSARAKLHLGNGGALTPANCQPRLQALAAIAEQAIIAESARWGDAVSTQPFTRRDWLAERDFLLNQWIPNRNAIFIGQLREDGLWLDDEPPPPTGDALDQVQLASAVTQGSNTNVSLRYQAAGPRDLQILLHDKLSNWRVVASKFVTVPAGQGQISEALPVDADARVGGEYLWAVRLIPSGQNHTQAVAQFYQDASVGQGQTTTFSDKILSFRPQAVVSGGLNALVDIDYEAAQARDLRVVLLDQQSGWRVVGQGLLSLTSGQGSRQLSLTVTSDARVGDGYIWLAQMIPANQPQAAPLVEAFQSASVASPGGGGGATRDALTNFTAPATLAQGTAVEVSVDYEATQTRDILVLLLDTQQGYRIVGQARTDVPPGVDSIRFTIGTAADARLGDGYVWVAQLLPYSAANGTAPLDQRFIGATMISPTVNLTNFAVLPQATATQSSVYGTVFTADLARDGNTDGDWRNGSVTHTELDPQPWWQVDLGASKPISSVLVWNRTDCCSDRMARFYVLVSDVPFGSNDLSALLSQPGVQATLFTGPPLPAARAVVGRSGRYVRVQLTDPGYLSMAEVEVLGSTTPGALVNGVTYEYYEGVWSQLPNFNTLAPLKTGTLPIFGLSPTRRPNYFGFRYRGCLHVPADGNYTLYCASDDGSKLLVDGAVVVDNDGLHGIVERSASVFLTAGMHPLELQYFENDSSARLEVSWSGPGFAKQVIPSSAMSINETGVSPSFRHRMAPQTSKSNADGDLFDLLAENALGLDPTTSDRQNAGLQVLASPGRVEVSYDRPKNLSEFVYTVEASADLRNWTAITDAEIIDNGDGTERVRCARAERLAPLSDAAGFVRLKMHHQVWNESSYTPISGWCETTLHQGFQTYGSCLNQPVVFASRILGVSANQIIGAGAGRLHLTGPAYVEITSGPHEGQRIAVDSARATGDQIVPINLADTISTLRSLPASGLEGASFVVRAHLGLGQLFPKESLTSNADITQADEALFFDGVGYKSFFLAKHNGASFWASADDSNLLTMDLAAWPPGVGAFFHRKAPGSVKIMTYGQVRQNAFVQPLRPGYNLLAPSIPTLASIAQHGLLQQDLLGGVDPAAADQIHLWMGDEDSASPGYTSLFLFGQQNQRFWTNMADSNLSNLNTTPLLPANRAYFLRVSGQASLLKMPGL